jgi:hypothetical protein
VADRERDGDRYKADWPGPIDEQKPCSRPDSSEAALAVFWILLIVLIVSALVGGVGHNRR